MKSNEPREVLIDGIKYVPAKDVYPANTRAIKLALIDYFWGDCSNDSDEELGDRWQDINIHVNDNGKGVTIDEVLERVTHYSREVAT